MEFFTEHGGAIVTGVVAVLVLLVTEASTSRRERDRWFRQTRLDAYARVLAAVEDVESMLGTAATVSQSRLDPQKLGLAIREYNAATMTALLVASPDAAKEIQYTREMAELEFDRVSVKGHTLDEFTAQIETLRKTMQADLK